MIRRLALAGGAAAIVLALAACSPATSPTESAAPYTPSPTVAPTLIPTPAPTITDVEAAQFKMSDGNYSFKVGDGPAWCTIDPANDVAVCEINEVSAEYDPVDVPATCDYSYGYQLRLTGGVPETGKPADFLCSGGPYADANKAKKLASGSRVQVGPFTCFVDEFAARCDNLNGSWIVLGPKAWALQNP